MHETKRFIAGCGTLNVDLLFGGVPRLPLEGEEVFSRTFSMQLGGGVPGTLINVSRLGIPVHLQTGLGTDVFSEFAKKEIAKTEIQIENIWEGNAGIPLNVSAVAITPNDRTIVSYTDGFQITDTLLERIYQASTGAKICIMDPRFPEVYQKLKQEGTILVLDTGWEDDLSIAKYREALLLADYYTPNQKEAMKITDRSNLEDAAKVLGDYFRQVIIKLDSRGCLICENGRQNIVPVIPKYAQNHIDSTGAGDAFLAGLLYGLYYDMPLTDCVLFGTITGGKCVTAIGCLSAYHTEQQLLSSFATYRRLVY